MREIERMVREYLDKECGLLTYEYPVHNISSDIIESDFGIFKESMPANKKCGFTESILYMPLRPKLSTLAKAKDIDIKTIMERRTVNEVEKWKKENLSANPVVRRMNLLSA